MRSTDGSPSGKATLVALCTVIMHLHAAKVDQVHAAPRAAALQYDVLRLHVPASQVLGLRSQASTASCALMCTSKAIKRMWSSTTGHTCCCGEWDWLLGGLACA